MFITRRERERIMCIMIQREVLVRILNRKKRGKRRFIHYTCLMYAARIRGAVFQPVYLIPLESLTSTKQYYDTTHAKRTTRVVDQRRPEMLGKYKLRVLILRRKRRFFRSVRNQQRERNSYNNIE